MDGDEYRGALAALDPERRDDLLSGSWPVVAKQVEDVVRSLPGAVSDDRVAELCPTVHRFEEGHYIRECRSPPGVLAVSRLHRVAHPFFLAEGEASVWSEDGVRRMVAPCWGITRAGTKRVIYMHTETVMVTVHPTDETTVEGVEAAVYADNDT